MYDYVFKVKVPHYEVNCVINNYPACLAAVVFFTSCFREAGRGGGGEGGLNGRGGG